MDSGCIQIRSRNATEERKWIERFGQEIKKNNGYSYSVIDKEQCGQIVHKEE